MTHLREGARHSGDLGVNNARWVVLDPRSRGRRDELVRHLETRDFPTKDPWSVYFRRVIGELQEKGKFNGRWVTEFGVGDGRNILAAGAGIAGFSGIEIDANRLRIAEANLKNHPEYDGVPRELIASDAVDYLDRWQEERAGDKLDGWAFICLPQAPLPRQSQLTQNHSGEDSVADVYDPNADKFAVYKEPWDMYGLTLNAAVLYKLRAIAADNLQVLIVNSDRVPTSVRERLIRLAGWDIDTEYTSQPIQQDPDTSIEWIVENGIDDGRRFWEKTPRGLLRPISAREAEERRQESRLSGKGRRDLNVYHNLSFYVLKPSVVYAQEDISDQVIFRANGHAG